MTSAAKRIAATTAAKNFGTLVDRVRDHGTTHLIERHGRPVAQIGPVTAVPKATLRGLAKYLRTAPKLDEQTLRFVEEGIDAINRPAVPDNPWER
jgi:antitoxin (DNA-binding transcriptional repressor) of toxin-antitoxin stability system